MLHLYCHLQLSVYNYPPSIQNCCSCFNIPVLILREFFWVSCCHWLPLYLMKNKCTGSIFSIIIQKSSNYSYPMNVLNWAYPHNQLCGIAQFFVLFCFVFVFSFFQGRVVKSYGLLPSYVSIGLSFWSLSHWDTLLLTF